MEFFISSSQARKHEHQIVFSWKKGKERKFGAQARKTGHARSIYHGVAGLCILGNHLNSYIVILYYGLGLDCECVFRYFVLIYNIHFLPFRMQMKEHDELNKGTKTDKKYHKKINKLGRLLMPWNCGDFWNCTVHTIEFNSDMCRCDTFFWKLAFSSEGLITTLRRNVVNKTLE